MSSEFDKTALVSLFLVCVLALIRELCCPLITRLSQLFTFGLHIRMRKCCECQEAPSFELCASLIFNWVELRGQIFMFIDNDNIGVDEPLSLKSLIEVI